MCNTINLNVSESGYYVSINIIEDNCETSLILQENDENINLTVAEYLTVDSSSISESVLNRIEELEDNTDGLIDGVDFLTLYRLKRDN